MKVLTLPAFCAIVPAVTPATAAPGDVESAFNMVVGGHGTNGSVVYCPMLHTDGRIVLGGWFAAVNSTARLNVARVSNTGLLDGVFNPGTSDATSPALRSIAMLEDGRVIIAGEFTSVGGAARGHIARLNANGTLDAAWDPGVNDWIYSSAVQPDGKLLIGGSFSAVGFTARNRLARLHADGMLDMAFNPNVNNTVRVQQVQPDGKIIIGGNFTSVGGQPRNRLARLNANGSLDTEFNPNVSGTVYTLALLPDGKILAGGGFTTVGGTARLNIAKLNTNGTLDLAFNPGANDNVRCLAVQTDGKVIIGGDFTQVSGMTRSRNARLTAAGALDSAFTVAASGVIYGLTIQQDGKVLTGGGFSTFGTFARRAIVRLENDVATQNLTIPSPGRVQWLRGGASPETNHVAFEVSTNGGVNWTALGSPARMTGGWEMTGLSLPPGGQLRARARVSGGYGNASSSVLESLTDYAFSPLQVWRFANFGSIFSTGNAADNADPDKDGAENAVEYAFALNPNLPDAALLPVWQLNDDDFSLSFTQPANVSGVSYLVEQSTALAPGTWTAIPNSSLPPMHTYYVSATAGSRRFLRLRVTVP